MTIEAKIAEAGLPKTSKMSARRAIQAILDRSTNEIPLEDLRAILRIIVEAL